MSGVTNKINNDLLEQFMNSKLNQSSRIHKFLINSIFIDNLGNNNDELEEEDFEIALKDENRDKVGIFRTAIEILYNDLLRSKKKKEIGKYIITEFDMPLQKKGVINRKKEIQNKETGKLILSSTTLISEKDGMTTVKINKERYTGDSVVRHEVEFQYNKKALENYIINEAVDSRGNKIKYFSEIFNIREISPEERSEEQKSLLSEFDTFVNSAINAGIDYGVDPKLIVSIIQQEVCFKGLAKNVTGKNGKGYMQLTSAPIKDYFGYAPDGKYHASKIGQYGPEVEELFISNGFDTSKAKTSSEKKKMYQEIFVYLKENKDAEFNIRLGTLVLRYYLDRADGDVTEAARNYNGSSEYKEKYSINVSKYNDKLMGTVTTDTSYICKKSWLQEGFEL